MALVEEGPWPAVLSVTGRVSTMQKAAPSRVRLMLVWGCLGFTRDQFFDVQAGLADP